MRIRPAVGIAASRLGFFASPASSPWLDFSDVRDVSSTSSAATKLVHID